MKRVLEVFGEPISKGGQESYVMSALQHMDLEKLHVDLFTPYYCDNQKYVDFIERQGGKVYTGKMPFVVGGTRREIIPALSEHLNLYKYDVVHIHSGSTSVLAYYAKVASKKGIKKVIVHSHSSGVKENVKHFLIKMYASRLFLKYATDYYACSKEAAIWKFPKSVLSKVRILNNGIDLEEFKYNVDLRNRIRTSLGIDRETLVLGHVGRFTHEKNQTFLIDILKKYIDENKNKKVRLLLVGDGEEFSNVKKKAIMLNVLDDVKFVGSSDRVSDFLQAMDIFLFPSLYEGLGIVGIEAQATGLPVIASTGVPRIMKVSEDVAFLPLSEYECWLQSIKKYTELILKRKSNKSEIQQFGFDVEYTSKDLANQYLN